jgi:hypothetical protein
MLLLILGNAHGEFLNGMGRDGTSHNWLKQSRVGSSVHGCEACRGLGLLWLKLQLASTGYGLSMPVTLLVCELFKMLLFLTDRLFT